MKIQQYDKASLKLKISSARQQGRLRFQFGNRIHLANLRLIVFSISLGIQFTIGFLLVAAKQGSSRCTPPLKAPEEDEEEREEAAVSLAAAEETGGVDAAVAAV